jgi:hypothetical protein
MPATAQQPVRDLQTHVQTSVLELQRQVWKARGHAKQKWLEQALAAPVKNPRDAEERAAWIERALELVKSGQEEVKYQAARLDAYAEHLSVLEMSLMAATEAKSSGDRAGDRATIESGHPQPRTDSGEPPTTDPGAGRRRQPAVPAAAGR